MEPAFLAENEEALLVAGYSKQYRGKTDQIKGAIIMVISTIMGKTDWRN